MLLTPDLQCQNVTSNSSYCGYKKKKKKEKKIPSLVNGRLIEPSAPQQAVLNLVLPPRSKGSEQVHITLMFTSTDHSCSHHVQLSNICLTLSPPPLGFFSVHMHPLSFSTPSVNFPPEPLSPHPNHHPCPPKLSFQS